MMELSPNDSLGRKFLRFPQLRARTPRYLTDLEKPDFVRLCEALQDFNANRTAS
jgi:hypothetical protein